MNAKVDGYLRRAKKWQDEMTRLRRILLGSELTEDLKWGKPCYTFQNRNVVLIIGFKNYCSLLFTKGALLKDPKGILIRPTENTQAARQIRFSNMRQVAELVPALKTYIKEAIAVEKAGLEVTYKKVSEFKAPKELERKFHKSSALKKAFGALTPGRQRAYLLHFSGAKQSITRESRIDKCVPRILAGKGLND